MKIDKAEYDGEIEPLCWRYGFSLCAVSLVTHHDQYITLTYPACEDLDTRHTLEFVSDEEAKEAFDAMLRYMDWLDKLPLTSYFMPSYHED